MLSFGVVLRVVRIFRFLLSFDFHDALILHNSVF